MRARYVLSSKAKSFFLLWKPWDYQWSPRDTAETYSRSLRLVGRPSFPLVRVGLLIVRHPSIYIYRYTVSSLLRSKSPSLLYINALCHWTDESHLCWTSSANALRPPHSLCDIALTTTLRPKILTPKHSLHHTFGAHQFYLQLTLQLDKANITQCRPSHLTKVLSGAALPSWSTHFTPSTRLHILRQPHTLIHPPNNGRSPPPAPRTRLQSPQRPPSFRSRRP